MVCESLIGLKNIEVWIKSHPFLQIKKVFELSGLLKNANSFQIKKELIGNLLSDARIVITGESSVCVEALIYGCNVLLINAPDWINMSPLKGIKSEMIRTVNSPKELRQAVIDIFKEEYDFEGYTKEGRSIVSEFFCLNQDSDIPSKFLKFFMKQAPSGREGFPCEAMV